jgi:hypothetical protein
MKQRAELYKLAAPQGYRVRAHGRLISITSPCLTAQFASNDAGYILALAWLASSLQGRERAKERTEKAEQTR